MLTDARPMAFVATTKPEAAKAFYAGTLGLRLVSDDRYAIVFDLAGTPLRVQKVEYLVPHLHTALGWVVPGIARAVTDLTARGVRFERYDVLPQDAQGIWTAPGGAQVAWFKDPDGNTLSLTQF